MITRLNLSEFFNDHRSRAIILINKDMKNIKDVEDHIARLFEIKKFYLKSGNHYLPSNEGIQILDQINDICVVPKAQKISNIDATTPTISNDFAIKPKKKKKKDNRADTNTDGEPDSTEVHKKKKKHTTHNFLPDSNHLTSSSTDKSKIRKDSNAVALESENGDSHGDKLLDVKSAVEKFEQNNQQNYNNERRINIVKTIILSNGISEVNRSQCASPDSLEQKEFQPAKVNDSSESKSYISNSNDTFNQSEVSSKRRRKRSRPSYKISKPGSTPYHTAVKPTPNLKLDSIPKLHIRFEKIENVDTITNVASESSNYSQLSNGICKINNECNTNEMETESDEHDKIELASKVELLGPRETKNAHFLNKVPQNKSSKDEMENFLERQPPLKETSLKLGDIISFKILRLSTDYTPEVSSNIMGRVLDYSNDKEVTIHIMYGHDQSTLPQGKFSLSPEEQNNEDENVNSDKLVCLWSSLIEPRLVYP